MASTFRLYPPTSNAIREASTRLKSALGGASECLTGFTKRPRGSRLSLFGMISDFC